METKKSLNENENRIENKIHDLVVIGTGTGGMTAAIYSARYMVDTVVIGNSLGGMIAEAHKVCNFPTYKEITGLDYTQKLYEQVKELNVPVVIDTVLSVSKFADKKNELFEIKTKQSIYKAKKVILAMGLEKRKLEIPGEKEFLGKGVSYCATCDGAFFRNKTVAVVGGSDSALTAALVLSEFANKVYIIYRKKEFFRAEPTWIKTVELNPKIESIFNSTITHINGSKKVESITLKDDSKLLVDGVFIEIGAEPNSKIVENLNVESVDKYIKTDNHQRTNVHGLFAAGDITNNVLKQLVTAAAEGAVAAYGVYEELKKESTK